MAENIENKQSRSSIIPGRKRNYSVTSGNSLYHSILNFRSLPRQPQHHEKSSHPMAATPLLTLQPVHFSKMGYSDAKTIQELPENIQIVLKPEYYVYLCFKDSSLEKAYGNYRLTQPLTTWRKTILITMLIFVIFYLKNILFREQDSVHREISIIFLVFAAVIPLTLFYLTSHWLAKKVFMEKIDIFSTSLILTCGLLNFLIRALILMETGHSNSYIILFGVFIPLIAFSSILKTRLIYFLFCLLLQSLVFIVYIIISPYPHPGDLVEVMVVFIIVSTCIAYERECFLRRQFISKMNYRKIYHRITRDKDDKVHVKHQLDTDTPLQKALEIIRNFANDPFLSQNFQEVFQNVLKLLCVSNVNAPMIEKQLNSGLVSIDWEQHKWLMNEYTKNRNHVIDTTAARKKSPPPVHDLVSAVSMDFSHKNETCVKVPELSHEDQVFIIDDIKQWSFNVFFLSNATMKCPLVWLSAYHFKSWELDMNLNVPFEKFIYFTRKIEEGYRPHLPYHNSEHAADVLQSAMYLADWNKITFLGDSDALALIIAAMIHDVDHPGYSNNFMINSGIDKLALLYNDRSVLENHHLHYAFSILAEEDANFMKDISKMERKTFRETIIELVMATDLAQHFNIIATFKNKLSSKFEPEKEREDRVLLLKIIMKCADISNAAKPFSYYEKWSIKVLEEFYRKGDKERELGLSISPFCDRHNINVASSQIGFINFVCTPLFDAYNQYNEFPEAIFHLQWNLEYWRKQEKTSAENESNQKSSKDLDQIISVENTSKSSSTTNSPIQDCPQKDVVRMTTPQMSKREKISSRTTR